MNIDEMQAGREMDKIIWIHLFGHEYKDWRVVLMPEYSKYIAAAWEVIEWLEDWKISVDWLPPDKWQAVFSTDEDGTHYSIADTAPLAICRAALKALGV